MMTYFFSLLFFLVPIVWYPRTAEVFEFNKMVLVYALTVLIIANWIIEMVQKKRIIFRRTILDIPLILFLISQIISTIVSIDPRTSVFGYPSRFHGGLLSSLAYSLLYWAMVSNLNKEKVKKLIPWLLSSAGFVSLYGILEHFGHSPSCLFITGQFDADCWVQDVQTRIFATLGQPNWLAAWLVSLLPLTWYLFLVKGKSHLGSQEQQSFKPKRFQRKCFYLGLSILFFLAFLFTKSRSGILGLITSFLIFGLGLLILSLSRLRKKKKEAKEKIRTSSGSFFLIGATLTGLILIVGTPWTPNLKEILTNRFNQKNSIRNDQETPLAIEDQVIIPSGGTESGEIRKIVWQGALEIWKHYPLFGTGVETFAYAYYQFRPLEHNLVSEWDFLYNKAHNEYLNFMANTGTVGLFAHLFLIVAMAWVLLPKPRDEKENLKIENYFLFKLALLSGWSSILVTNFFGFSVVPVALHFFLFPALVNAKEETEKEKSIKFQQLDNSGKFWVILVSLLAAGLLILIARYWYADKLYAQGKLENDQEQIVQAIKDLKRATELQPGQAVYHDELAQAYTKAAILLLEGNEATQAGVIGQQAIWETNLATTLSPRNVNLIRGKANILNLLSILNPRLLSEAQKTLEDLTRLAPTDAKTHYGLALSYAKSGEKEKTIQTLEKTIQLKPNYKKARQSLALIYQQENQPEKAREQLEYILKYIDPNDQEIPKELEKLK